jgi:hypothetical protein
LSTREEGSSSVSNIRLDLILNSLNQQRNLSGIAGAETVISRNDKCGK